MIKISRITCFFKYFRSFFILVNDPQAPSVNAGCFKFISGMNLCPPNESFLIVYFSFCIIKRTSPTTECDWEMSLLANSAIINKLLAPWQISIFCYCTLHILIKASFFFYLSLQILDFDFWIFISTLQIIRLRLFNIYFKLSINHLALPYQSFKLFKVTVNTVRITINFSVYFAFYLKPATFSKLLTHLIH